MISHEDAVKMCEILKQRRKDKERQRQYDATGYQVNSIARTKKRLMLKHGVGRNYISY